MNIEIKYTGKYPNLCSGQLTVVFNGKEHIFPDYCMRSRGCCGFRDGEEYVEQDEWVIRDECWVGDFTDVEKEKILEAINEKILWGCCGGCL
jgi:hypothetical protein